MRLYSQITEMVVSLCVYVCVCIDYRLLQSSLKDIVFVKSMYRSGDDSPFRKTADQLWKKQLTIPSVREESFSGIWYVFVKFPINSTLSAAAAVWFNHSFVRFFSFLLLIQTPD